MVHLGSSKLVKGVGRKATNLIGSIAKKFGFLNYVSLSKKTAFWSALALAFLIAPIAALTLSSKPGTTKGASLLQDSSSLSDAQNQNGDAQGNVSSEDANNLNDSSTVVHADSSGNVTVDGEQLEVPDNGTVTKTITSDDGQQTHVNISSTSSTSSSGDRQHTSSHLRVSSHSTSNNNSGNSL